MDRTTIQLQDETKDELDGLKRVDGESYDSVVKMLIANYGDESSDAIDGHSDGGLSYDDVRQACASAITDELPVDEMGGRRR